MNQLKLLRTFACKVTGGFLLVVLASCGGSSSNDSGGTTATQLQGYYQASVGGSDFVSIVLPATNGVARWYGWYYNGADVNDGFLYFGSLLLGVNGAAQSVGPTVSFYRSGFLSTQTVTIRQASLSGFNATITDSPNPNYSMTATSQSSLQNSLENIAPKTWNGKWSNKGDVTATVTHDFYHGGTLTSTVSFRDCNNPNNSLVLSPEPGTNFYKAELTIFSSTGCTWAIAPIPSQKLTGFGLIYISPDPTKKRLDLMLLDNDGSGVSYRGEANL